MSELRKLITELCEEAGIEREEEKKDSLFFSTGELQQIIAMIKTLKDLASGKGGE